METRYVMHGFVLGAVVSTPICYPTSRLLPQSIAFHSLIYNSKSSVHSLCCSHSGHLVLWSPIPGKQHRENIAFPFCIWLDRKVGQPNVHISSMFLQCSLPAICDPSKKSLLCQAFSLLRHFWHQKHPNNYYFAFFCCFFAGFYTELISVVTIAQSVYM